MGSDSLQAEEEQVRQLLFSVGLKQYSDHFVNLGVTRKGDLKSIKMQVLSFDLFQILNFKILTFSCTTS